MAVPEREFSGERFTLSRSVRARKNRQAMTPEEQQQNTRGSDGVAAAAPKIADMLELDPDERASGIWDQDFLALGSRLRPIYGNDVSIASAPAAYRITLANALTVSVTCPPHGSGDARVRVSASVLDLAGVDLPGIFEFALRENADLQLARLAARDGWLVAEHELPLRGTGIPAFEASVGAVAGAARKLRAELAPAVGHVAH